jgi:hypothetical protein
LTGWGFAKLAPYSVNDLAGSAAAITAQQVALGRWAAANLPKTARIGLNDAGAITFFSGLKTHDLVGLTTRDEAKHWLAGVGSRFEHYERLRPEQRPTHFIVYPGWFGLNELLGTWLTERRVDGATILGGPVMVAHEASYALLGSGERPSTPVRGSLIDELDVADLVSEAQHHYELGSTAAHYNVLYSDGERADGGRAERLLERFTLRARGGGTVVLRLSTSEPSRLSIEVDGLTIARRRVEAGPFQELPVDMPVGVGDGGRFEVRADPPIALFHYWSYAPP